MSQTKETHFTTITEVIGYCAVDSGQIMITDPGYLNYWEDNAYGDSVPRGHFSYAGACDITLSGQAGQFNFPKGHEGIGVVARSGYGDGYYPVYATYLTEYADADCTKQIDKRIAKLEIIFIDDEDGE